MKKFRPILLSLMGMPGLLFAQDAPTFQQSKVQSHGDQMEMEAQIESRSQALEKFTPPKAQQVNPAATAPNPWKTEVAVGADASQGNTDGYNANASVAVTYEKDGDRVKVSATGSLGATDGLTTAERAKASLDAEKTISGPIYGNVNGFAESDKIANTEYRVSAGAGVGTKLVDSEKVKLRTEAGPNYVQERYYGQESVGTVRARVAQKGDLKINERAKLYQSVEWMGAVNDFSNYLTNIEAGVETGVTEQLKLRLQVQDRYNSRPAEGKTENDLGVSSSLVISY